MARKGNYIDVDELKALGMTDKIEAVPLEPDADGNLRHSGLEDGYSWVTNGQQPVTPEYAQQNRGDWGIADNAWLNDNDWNAIQVYKQQYENAKLAGDQAGMDAAHAAAENIRKGYGYSGGVDGSAYNPTMIYTKDLYADEDDYEDERGSGGSASVKDTGFSYEDAPQYLSRWQERIDALADAILNRPAFSYDPETDPTYQQYKAGYTRDGKRAMQDTLAQVSARTGGMASSYGVGASQQTFNNYMAQLADKIPELKQLAYSMYMDDLAQDRNDLSMLMGLEQSDYGKYLDQLGQWNTDRNFDYGVHRDDVADSQWQQQFDYGVSRDQVADSQWQQSFDYQKEQDKLAQQNWQTQWDYQLEQDALARQDALNKLLSGNTGGSTPAAKPDIMGALSGMSEDEAQLYLIMEGYSQNERETIMEIFRNSNAQPSDYTGPEDLMDARPEYEGAVDLTGKRGSNYQDINNTLKQMKQGGADTASIRKAINEAYNAGLLTETDYQRLINQYR